MKGTNLYLISLLLLSVFTYANASSSTADMALAKYVSVNFQVQGLDETTLVLKETMAALSLSIKNISESPEKLSPEQIREFSLLVEQSNSLVMSLERVLSEIQPAIRRAKKPSSEMLSNLLATTRTEMITPTVESVKNTVSYWLYLLVFGGIVVVGLILLSLYTTTRQIHAAVNVMKSITREYEIVRRKD